MEDVIIEKNDLKRIESQNIILRDVKQAHVGVQRGSEILTEIDAEAKEIQFQCKELFMKYGKYETFIKITIVIILVLNAICKGIDFYFSIDVFTYIGAAISIIGGGLSFLGEKQGYDKKRIILIQSIEKYDSILNSLDRSRGTTRCIDTDYLKRMKEKTGAVKATISMSEGKFL